MREHKVWAVHGTTAIVFNLAALATGVYLAISGAQHQNWMVLVPGIILAISAAVALSGNVIVQPNEARAIVLFGRYLGSLRESGWWWTVPLTVKPRVSLRVRNFNSERLKVNDAGGSPIEIAAVIVYRVTDSAKALFEVDSYEEFVSIQSETAVRHLASRYPYDAPDEQESSLRTNPEEVADVLKNALQDRLTVAGVEVMEARLTHLAYAPEVAAAMLQRQQASAIVAARQKIVEGAVGMVEMALTRLQQDGLVELDEERKAVMVNNLMVAIVGERGVQPVINAGTLY